MNQVSNSCRFLKALMSTMLLVAPHNSRCTLTFLMFTFGPTCGVVQGS